MFIKIFVGVVALCSIALSALANDTTDTPIFNPANIADFVERAYTPTYDCPTASLNEQIDAAIILPSLTDQQLLQLTSMKSHGLICAGDLTQAQSMLQRLLENDVSDRSARYYASAIFQYGFIYDLQEKPERCDYYTLARDSAKGNHDDVHLSASLGYITECQRDDVNAQVFGLYELLDTVTKMNNPAAMAHAYNRVGGFYGSKGQNGLAAAQYAKAYEIGKSVYTDENLLSVLGSLITALQATNDLPATKEALDIFRQINAKSGTNRTLFLQYLFEAAYFVSVKDYVSLESTLNGWREVVGESDSSVRQGLLRWYTGELCYYKNDTVCLTNFLESEKNAPASYKNYINKSKRYLRFVLMANIRVGDTSGSAAAFEYYQEKVDRVISNTQDNYNAVDLSRLHSKIVNLEATREADERSRFRLFVALVVALLILCIAVLFYVRRKYIESKSYDSVTGVLTNTAIIKKLSGIGKPSPNCTNSLAIFDIANFTEVNLTLGPTKSDFVLEQIANTLKKITRSSDLLGRFGPEQFIICLVDIEEDAAQAFFDRAKDALTNTFADHNNHQAISVDSSMSIYYSTETFDDLTEILNNMLLSLSMKADQA